MAGRFKESSPAGNEEGVSLDSPKLLTEGGPTVAKKHSHEQQSVSNLEKLVVPDAGPILRSIRLSEQLTIDDLAARTKLDRSQISRYESGEVAVNLRVLEVLAKAVGVKPTRVIAECHARLLKKLRDRYGKRTDIIEMVDEIRRHLDVG